MDQISLLESHAIELAVDAGLDGDGVQWRHRAEAVQIDRHIACGRGGERDGCARGSGTRRRRRLPRTQPLHDDRRDHDADGNRSQLPDPSRAARRRRLAPPHMARCHAVLDRGRLARHVDPSSALRLSPGMTTRASDLCHAGEESSRRSDRPHTSSICLRPSRGRLPRSASHSGAALRDNGMPRAGGAPS